MQYKVVWTIDIEANSPKEAAEEALAIQRDKGSEATAFEVRNPNTGKLIENVDLFMSLYPNIEELLETPHSEIVDKLCDFEDRFTSDMFYDENNIPIEITIEILERFTFNLDDFEAWLSNE